MIARGHCRQIVGGVAEDCVQEAFIRLARQESVIKSPSAWLMKAVRNAAIDAVRTEQRRTSREQAVAREQPQWLAPVESSETADHSTDDIQRALEQLEDTTRDIVIAHLWNNMTFRQIAESLEASHATVHRKYETGLQRIRQLMTHDQISVTPTASTTL